MKEKRYITVIDLKAFYSFVECVERGLDPFKTPLVVADKDRGKNTIVLSVSPYLKSKGVPSRCRIKELPKGYDYIYATPRMEKYIEKSSEVMSIFMDFVSEEDLHIYSIDEAFLDLTSYLNYYKMSAKELVKHILDTVKEKTSLCATAGIGDNFFLAKVALDVYAKKEADGIAIMHKEDIYSKLWPITPLSKIWGIGKRFEARLNALGIFTMKDLALSSKEYISKHFGVIGEQMLNHANGIDDSDIREVYIPKSTSLTIGQVLMKDYSVQEAELIIREMCDDLGFRMRNEGKQTSLISLYIGYSKEGGFAKQMSLLKNTYISDELYDSLICIYRKNVLNRPIRRISINFANLVDIDDYEQMDLFNDDKKQLAERNLQFTMDEIRKTFGNDTVFKASSLLSFSTMKERHNQIGGHRK